MHRRTACRRLSLTGAGGIRTPGAFRHNGFQDRRLKPLGHCSTHLLSRSTSEPEPFLCTSASHSTPNRPDFKDSAQRLTA